MGQQRVHILLELAEMASPLSRLGEADILLTLPPHRVEQHNAKWSDDSPPTGRKWPQRRRRTFARDDAGGPNIPQFNQCHQRHSAVRATARRIKVNCDLATGGDSE